MALVCSGWVSKARALPSGAQSKPSPAATSEKMGTSVVSPAVRSRGAALPSAGTTKRWLTCGSSFHSFQWRYMRWVMSRALTLLSSWRFR